MVKDQNKEEYENKVYNKKEDHRIKLRITKRRRSITREGQKTKMWFGHRRASLSTHNAAEETSCTKNATILMEMRWTGCGNGAPGYKCLDRNRWKLGTSVGLGLLIIKPQAEN